MPKAVTLIGLAVVYGLLAGVFLDVATFLMARYGPQFGHWSFRGNGALAVPFGLGPAILAAVWAALVLRYRGFPNWLRLGAWRLAAGIGYLVVSVIVMLVADFDPMLLIIPWMVVAPIIAAFLRPPAQVARPGALAEHVGAGLGFAVAMVIAFYVTGLVLAPGS